MIQILALDNSVNLMIFHKYAGHLGWKSVLLRSRLLFVQPCLGCHKLNFSVKFDLQVITVFKQSSRDTLAQLYV